MTIASVDKTKPEVTQNMHSDPLLEPLKIRNLTLKNRILSTSHASGMDDGGMPAYRYQRYHEEKAKGGLALTMFGGSSNISPDSPSVFGQLRVDDDKVIPYFQSFSERIHQHGTALMCQITHLGRRGDATLDNWLPTIAPSRVRETLHRSIPREMDRHDIERVIKDYGQAARRCFEGGLDGLETVASGHLIGQFFSPMTNLRTDEFGGSIENRARFAIMVHEEIRKQVGDDFVIGMRLSIEENPGALSFDDAIEISQLLERLGLIDFFNCNMGRMDTELSLAEYNMPGMAQPLSPFLDKVGAFKKAVGLPVFHAARIVDVASARHGIRNGLLDMVGMTRAHIADPQLVAKIERGEEDRIRPCTGASHCLIKMPHCIHNATTGRETLLPNLVALPQEMTRKVVVVGGGPAGLEAARVSAERGHNVILFEAAANLGGQVLIAAKASWRADLISIVDWRINELEHLGVDVRFNTYADVGTVTGENPEVVIIATGGVPSEMTFEGNELCNTVWDVLTGQVPAAKSVLICDGTGRHEAVSCADHLAGLGSFVSLCTIDSQIAHEMGGMESSVYKKRLYEKGVEMLYDLRIGSVQKDDNRLTATLVNELTGQTSTHIADQIIVEGATQPVDELFLDLRAESINDGVTDIDELLSGEHIVSSESSGYTLHRIGDAVSSRSIHACILEAYRIALNI